MKAVQGIINALLKAEWAYVLPPPHSTRKGTHISIHHHILITTNDYIALLHLLS